MEARSHQSEVGRYTKSRFVKRRGGKNLPHVSTYGRQLATLLVQVHFGMNLDLCTRLVSDSSIDSFKRKPFRFPRVEEYHAAEQPFELIRPSPDGRLAWQDRNGGKVVHPSVTLEV